MGITLPTTDIASFVEVVLSKNLQEWGFVVVRATYDSEEDWTQFRKLWDESMEDQLKPENGEGIEAVSGKLKFEWIDNKAALDGKDMDEIRR